ncbi:hypothetical protein [Pseudomonas sp. B33.4]|uniref:hypothetical protein n=1 Tax=Pseudomonas sp. B33.4 TaxID=3104265 RepID=UPI002ADEE251|nr:hypothetical protein [Pseudomonas sp. B33.4]
MVMVADAFKNYLVEVTVMGIAKECEESGMLSAAIHARHKVRKTDLEFFFERASQVDKGSWERRFYTGCLIVYALAAYESIEGIINSGKSAFGQSAVKPHWSKEGKTHTLESIVFYEPLNLFPGLSTDNLSSNHTTIDQHVAAHYSDGTSKSMAMMSHQQREKPTTNQITAQHILLQSHGQSVSSPSPQTPLKQSGFKTHGTPLSDTLSKGGRIAGNITTNSSMDEDLSTFDAAKKKMEKNNAAHVIHERVNALCIDAQSLTMAGVKHYDNLIVNYKKALLSLQQASDDLDFEATLMLAKQNWMIYRGALEQSLNKLKEETLKEFPLT